jgi:hypothetical protein
MRHTNPSTIVYMFLVWLILLSLMAYNAYNKIANIDFKVNPPKDIPGLINGN